MPGITAITQATPNSRRITFRLIDRKGDKRAYGFEIPSATAPTDILINAVLSAYADCTNAYLYGVEVTEVYGLPALASNALNSPYVSLDSVVGVLYKADLGGLYPDVRLEIRAPSGSMVLEGEVVDITQGDYVALRTAFDALLTGTIGTAYSPISARFTERKDKNSAVPAV